MLKLSKFLRSLTDLLFCSLSAGGLQLHLLSGLLNLTRVIRCIRIIKVILSYICMKSVISGSVFKEKIYNLISLITCFCKSSQVWTWSSC